MHPMLNYKMDGFQIHNGLMLRRKQYRISQLCCYMFHVESLIKISTLSVMIQTNEAVGTD